MARSCNIVYLGLWAQRLSKKPIDWVWAGSHKRTMAFIDAMKTAAFQSGILYVDTYNMTLPMIELSNHDGIHFDARVTRAIAMLLPSFMEGGQIQAHSSPANSTCGHAS
jgi:hypothetical protein